MHPRCLRPFVLALPSLLLLGCWAGAADAADAANARLDGNRIDLPAGRDDTVYTVSPAGGTLAATRAVTCGGSITLENAGSGGLTATVFAVSLRATSEDDWRGRADKAGTRSDVAIDLPTPAAGTPDERKRFGVAGSDADWDGFSIQWDGMITIPTDGVTLATSSDDGSRVWLDRNGDGVVTAEEWGSNNWGGGQGTTEREVHRAVPAGRYAIRVQFEDGGGPNSCRLLWRGANGNAQTQVVPPEAFRPFARLVAQGPVTLACPIRGGGFLECGDGVHLAVRPEVAALTLHGRVALAADLDLRGVPVQFAPDAVLDCAGHALQLDRVSTSGGAGSILLGGGRLTLPASVVAATPAPGLPKPAVILPLSLVGPGTLSAAPGTTQVAGFDDAVTVVGQSDGDAFTVRDARHCRARVELRAPLTTVLALGDDAPGDRSVVVDVQVPAGAPADLGIGMWRADRTGRWFQRIHAGVLAPGMNRGIRFDVGGDDALQAEGHSGRWTASAAMESGHLGILCFASERGSGMLDVTTHVVARPEHAAGRTTLTDLVLDGWETHAIRTASATTGRRWELHVSPDPYPADPYDAAEFRMDLEVTEPDGTRRIFAGFHEQEMRRHDDGDRESFTAIGAPRFSVRFRPRVPGLHRLRLITSDHGGPERSMALGDLLAAGEPGDGIARVDAQDPRFFSADGRFVWPLGHSINSTYDVRSVSSLHSKLTIDRGSFVREALLERLAANGGTGCETWLSAWNLGLEWIPRWPGYHGTGRYHEGHAAALDRFLDQAERLGAKVNLSIFNHGMARSGEGAEMEWPYHPYNRANGGWLDAPEGLFTDPRAFAYQQRLFRYITARYSDSPALLGWKLWAEVNLANAPHDAVVEWHRKASIALSAADPYGRAVTTHWCGDWTAADRAIATIPTIGYLTIDAYHGPGTALPGLLCQSTRDPLAPGAGLADLRKPVVVTEFGGSPGACAVPRLEAEHALGPWVGFVSGHAASPMLWWFEWIDQGARYGVYRALSRYIAGEDLRGKNAACVAPTATVDGVALWCRAWRDGTHWLGYMVDPAWSVSGGEGRAWSGGTLTLDDEVSARELVVEWWDADTGAVVGGARIAHGGGRPVFAMPEFHRHLAFKIH